MKNIDFNKAIQPEENTIVFVVRFTFATPIATKKFVYDAQEIIYDELGASGNFRLAPKYKRHLNANFVEFAGHEAQVKNYFAHKSNEIICAFSIRAYDPDVTLAEEAQCIAEEINQFCQRTKSTVEQMDVNTMYKE